MLTDYLLTKFWFPGAVLIIVCGLPACQQTPADSEVEKASASAAGTPSERKVVPQLTEDVDMLPKIGVRAISTPAAVTAPAQRQSGDTNTADAALAPIEDRARLEYMNSSNEELRRKVKELEARLEHLDAVSREKSEAIDAVSKQLQQQ